MAEVGRRQAHALAPLLTLASVALLVLLAFNLRNLDPGAEQLPPPLPEVQPNCAIGDPSAGCPSAAGTSGEWLRALFLATIWSFVGIAVVGAVYLKLKGAKLSKLLSPWELLGFALSAAFLAALFLYYGQIVEGLNGLARWVTGSRDPGGSGGGGFLTGLTSGSPSAILLLAAAVIVVVYLIVFSLHFFPKLYDMVTYREPDVGRSKRALARAVRTAIRDLEAGWDFRAAVLRCYGSMVLLFESRGTRADPSQTAREFEADALTRLGVSREGVDDLTSLFEEARYSDHAIGEVQRDAAIGCLTAIRTELEAGA